VQKALTRRVLDAISVKIAPKERAALMRVETADLGAFTSFSKGLSLFDDKRYDEALEAIKDARRRDQDFKLAATTQAEYERVVAELRIEAVAISVREKAAASGKDMEATKVERAALDQLYAYAARKGDGARNERVAALGALAAWLSASRPTPSAPPAIPDDFTRNCMADSAMQNYLSEALRLYPKVALVPPRVEHDMVLQHDAFAAEFRKLVGATSAPRRNELFPSVGDLGHAISRMHLAPADRADLYNRVYRMALALGPTPEWKAEHLMELARLYREATAFDRSTDFFKQAADASTGSDRGRALQDVADEIEINKAMSRALKAATTPIAREAVQWAALKRRYELESLSAGSSPRDLYERREFAVTNSGDESRGHGPVFIGKHAIWDFGMYDHALTTGPRREGVRASEVRYFWEEKYPTRSENLAIADCTPHKDLSVRFTLSFAPPADFWPSTVPAASAEAVAAGVDPRRPVVGLLFGVSHPECCEAHGYSLLLLPDAVRLVSLNQNPPELKAHEQYAKKVLEEHKLDLRGGTLNVSIKVSSAGIDVEASGKTVRLRSPDDRGGFSGLYFGGHGYAAVNDLTFSGP
jgi:tetratricopeptide (TPR) repeat protein